MCLLTTRIVKKIGYVLLLVGSYAGLCIFLLAHLYPSVYVLLPSYIILGVTLGPSLIAKWNLVVFFASRISCGQNDCNNTSVDGADEHKAFCNRDERVRRLARWYHASENIGIVLGALIAAFVMTCASNTSQCFYERNEISNAIHKPIYNESIQGTEKINRSNVTKSVEREYDNNVEPTSSQLNQLFDNFYEINEQGQRICGAGSCPVWIYYGELNYTESIDSGAHNSTMPLIIAYMTLAIIALALTCLSQQIDNSFKCESIKGMTDFILYAGPMSFFIGTEQGYMLGDFTKVSINYFLTSLFGQVSIVIISGIRFLLNGTEHCSRIVNWNGFDAISGVMYFEYAAETYKTICCFR